MAKKTRATADTKPARNKGQQGKAQTSEKSKKQTKAHKSKKKERQTTAHTSKKKGQHTNAQASKKKGKQTKAQARKKKKLKKKAGASKKVLHFIYPYLGVLLTVTPSAPQSNITSSTKANSTFKST